MTLVSANSCDLVLTLSRNSASRFRLKLGNAQQPVMRFATVFMFMFIGSEGYVYGANMHKRNGTVEGLLHKLICSP